MFINQKWPSPRQRTPLADSSSLRRWLLAACKKALSIMPPNRRLFGWRQLASRLCLLVIWTLAVIFILYMVLDTSSSRENREIFRTTRQDEHPFQQPQPQQQVAAGPARPEGQPLNGDSSDTHKLSDTNSMFQQQKPSQVPTAQQRAPSSTTRKSPTSEYSRRSEIFILIMQDEDQRSKMTSSQRPSGALQLYPSSASSSTIHHNQQSAGQQQQERGRRKLIIPEHIQIVMEILDYHRIGYTVDSTRHGLPEELLLEVGAPPDRRRHSVMIIDDFLKYTKLNRWIRDQLDRFCVSNQIGVITYLLDNHKLDHHIASAKDGGASLSGPSAGDRATTTGQFPLTIEPVEQNCRNSSSSGCLVDYQISARTQILRLLKRRESFIIKGALNELFGGSPLQTMASNHITYEPLTWASLREPSLARSRRHGHGWPGSARRQPRRNDSNLSDARWEEARQQSDDGPRPARLSANAVTRHTDHDERSDEAAAAAALHDSVRRSHVRKRRRAVLQSPGEVTREWPDVVGSGEPADSVRALSSSPSSSLSSGEEDDYTPDDVDNLRDDAAAAPDESDAASRDDQSPGSATTTMAGDDLARRRVLSMVDRGLYDGIKRVIFAVTNRHWTNRLLLLDTIEHLSAGAIMTPLERYVQIDVDDIFVGESGTRLNRSDVEALVQGQRQLARLFEGGQFKFNLGFSGKHFKRGNRPEQQGDEALIEQAHQFTWFCHFWSHSKAHLMNDSESLASELERNLAFARDKGLTLIGHARDKLYEPGQLPPTYAVAPHHSGVYPLDERLYEAWRQILNVQVTSTEEYPHLRPASNRRGFVHKDIKVLPRQICGLYTHTIYRRKYPGGFGRLVASIRGGELFETILHNPVNVYMTHMSNYANDRLALYTFTELFKFVQANTNLRLRYAPTWQGRRESGASNNNDDDNDSDNDNDNDNDSNHDDDDDAPNRLGPLELANYYFDLYPSEREPLWTNPCQDKRHLAIWAPRKQAALCKRVPNLLVVGPQKTGTTALYAFLKLNSVFKTSAMSPDDFEEVQFFNDKHYLRGSDWYFARFLSADTHASDRVGWRANSSTTKGRRGGALRLKGRIGATNGNGSGDDNNNNNNNHHHDDDDDGDSPLLPNYYLDKSATYFDDPKVPRRAAALLPDATIVILLIDPADRAYSWYQHMKAHGDPIATELSFDELLFNSSPRENIERRRRRRRRQDQQQLQHEKDQAAAAAAADSTPASSLGPTGEQEPLRRRKQQIQALRNRCLKPGYYSSHLSSWLQHFDSRQIIIIDGEWFKYNPVVVMNRLQVLLRVPKAVDYAHLLAYNEQKGFYCERLHTESPMGGAGLAPQLKCLGSGKGRKYAPMSPASRAWLNGHFLAHNKRLAKLLYEIGQPLPTWLDQSINRLPV